MKAEKLIQIRKIRVQKNSPPAFSVQRAVSIDGIVSSHQPQKTVSLPGLAVARDGNWGEAQIFHNGK